MLRQVAARQYSVLFTNLFYLSSQYRIRPSEKMYLRTQVYFSSKYMKPILPFSIKQSASVCRQLYLMPQSCNTCHLRHHQPFRSLHSTLPFPSKQDQSFFLFISRILFVAVNYYSLFLKNIKTLLPSHPTEHLIIPGQDILSECNLFYVIMKQTASFKFVQC